MNIEEILPELFGEKRVYYCQRCLNHGLEVKRKNHKADCVYRFCVCTDCQANSVCTSNIATFFFLNLNLLLDLSSFFFFSRQTKLFSDISNIRHSGHF